MTLILATTLDARVLIATDSSRGMVHGEVNNGEKAITLLGDSLLVTGFGDFGPPLPQLATRPGIETQLASCSSRSERVSVIAEALCAFQVRAESHATCLVFGFEGMVPFVDRIDGSPEPNQWRVKDPLNPRLYAGRLEAIGFPAGTELAPMDHICQSELAFWAWANHQMEAAANWCAERDAFASIQLPVRTYALSQPT